MLVIIKIKEIYRANKQDTRLINHHSPPAAGILVELFFNDTSSAILGRKFGTCPRHCYHDSPSNYVILALGAGATGAVAIHVAANPT